MYNTNIHDRNSAEGAVESRQPSREIHFDGRILFAAIAALSVSWSPAASAANESALPCNYKIAKNLQSLDVSVNEFTVSAIDHEIGASVSIVTPSFKNKSSVEDAIVAPVLDLTPRVANILNAVFVSPSDVKPASLRIAEAREAMR